MRPDHAARRAALRARLGELDLDAALVTGLANVTYLTGFTGSHAAALVRTDTSDAVLATDGRYRAQAEREAPDLGLLVDRDVGPALARRAAGEGLRRLGFEEHVVTVAQHDALAAAAPQSTLCRLGRAVEALRVVKDDAELQLLRQACAISDRALADLLPAVTPGRTERSVARELEQRLLDHGADGPAFATIVATGPHSAVPHHRPTSRAIAAGDLLKIDFGARYGGYHADCTRTFVVAAEPAPWQARLHALVLAAQRAGRAALRAGTAVSEVDRAARSVIEEAGHGAQFPHPLGHGVGLEIHEAPLVGASTGGRLAARTPVTVEPGVYLDGRGGVRIEDTLVVRDTAADPTGAPELLTTTTHELLVLG